MKLLIISHTPHYQHEDQIVGWGPTTREIDQLAQLFEQVIHVAPLHSGPAPESSLPYSATNIRFRSVVPTGGDKLHQKISILARIPEYVTTIKQEMNEADIVHVRCPASISLIALFILIFSSMPKSRWIKYAGNWNPKGKDPISYIIQRWILANNFHRGVVSVNGSWKNQPQHIYTFCNPCLTQEERIHGIDIARKKIFISPYRFLFVGRLDSAKGVGRILKICAMLKQEKFLFQMDFVGDGPERAIFEQTAKELKINEITHFHGWLPRQALNQYYSDAHIIMFPSSSSEGWPKVLSEAMAYGAVPIASSISSIPQVLNDTNAGFAFPPDEINAFVNTIENFSENPLLWKTMSQNAVIVAGNYTYDHYLEMVNEMLSSLLQRELSND